MTASNRYKNSWMENLLESTQAFGMKRVHLDLWQPHNFQESNSKTGAPDAFTSDIRNAIVILIRKMKLSPMNAVLEVTRLTSAEALSLVELYELGITGQFIREHRGEYEFTHANFYSSLQFLIKDRKISRDDALSELKGLSAPERYALVQFYKSGLRGELLRALRMSDHAEEFSALFDSLIPSNHQLKSDYLVSVIRDDIAKGVTWEKSFQDAANEARALMNVFSFKNADPRLSFLISHVKDGVRANDVPFNYDVEKQKTYRVLRWVHRLSVRNALAEMNGLDNEQIMLLRKHFSSGLTHDVLVKYPHRYELTNALMKHFQWTPLTAVKNLSELTVTQARYLHDFARHGYTFAEAKALNCGDYNGIKRDVVLSMVEWGCDLRDTLNKVMAMNPAQAQTMLSHTVSAPRVVPIKL